MASPSSASSLASSPAADASSPSQAPPSPPHRQHEIIQNLRRQLYSPNCSSATRTLSYTIERRIATPSWVTAFLREGADPNAEIRFQPPVREHEPLSYDLLSIAIDDQTGCAAVDFESMSADGQPPRSRLSLPTWESRQRQREILEALIAGGADLDCSWFRCEGGFPYEAGMNTRPIREAVANANLTALEVLLRHGVRVRGLCIIFPPRLWNGATPTPQYERALLEVYRRLLQRDSTLASERVPESRPPSEQDSSYELDPLSFYEGGPSEVGNSAVHHLVETAQFSRRSVFEYIEILTAIDASILTQPNQDGLQPLLLATAVGHDNPRIAVCSTGEEAASMVDENPHSPNIHAIECICRKVRPADVDNDEDGTCSPALEMALQTLGALESPTPTRTPPGSWAWASCLRLAAARRTTPTTATNTTAAAAATASGRGSEESINEWRQAVRTLLRWGTAAVREKISGTPPRPRRP
ncbi:unnamed protein product [Vitrella brassicaformis CCMP3155]|uniref:Uncharacterized protein n=1 Tax=Vitrella brassicaformis (strain CCMP3155) TaxID=1169540 RepID=A0A0G4ELC6_VITBC|nr:unnamed protein product [Vitrella brassicaformis CCMP3155]|eukprot:CEL97981.1 unnamed protein product [Vitrella brassicaformis CCMP3155]